MSQEQWLNYLDNDGRVQNFDEIKQIVFRGVSRLILVLTSCEIANLCNEAVEN